ncbi:MAG: hypothetical protein U5K56_19585 [Halioglobus sp.]|nr:hypothetical protein [Halioglobus sp.]
MKVSGSADKATQDTATRPDGALAIEIIRDEHYRQTPIYCSWQEILDGNDKVATPETPPSANTGDLTTG